MNPTECKITHYPAKVLGQKALPVGEIDENIRQIVEKMADIMIEHRGVGLAGPQAGVPLRIFIISVDGSREGIKVFINPKVEPEGELAANEEGCLSVPGVYTKVRRYEKCKVTATGLDGKEFTDEADGLYARALQHENDHIDGFTILNRMSGAAKIVHRKQIKRLEERNGEQGI